MKICFNNNCKKNKHREGNPKNQIRIQKNNHKIIIILEVKEDKKSKI